jgi:hypothetical protein
MIPMIALTPPSFMTLILRLTKSKSLAIDCPP